MTLTGRRRCLPQDSGHEEGRAYKLDGQAQLMHPYPKPQNPWKIRRKGGGTPL